MNPFKWFLLIVLAVIGFFGLLVVQFVLWGLIAFAYTLFAMGIYWVLTTLTTFTLGQFIFVNVFGVIYVIVAVVQIAARLIKYSAKE